MAKILLVEDDAFISDIIQTKLCKAGFKLHAISDGNSVHTEINEYKPNLVLLDLMIPNKNGFKVLEEIRNNELTANLPVIVLSNENGLDVKDKCEKLDAKYFFKAMTDMDELVEIVCSVLP